MVPDNHVKIRCTRLNSYKSGAQEVLVALDEDHNPTHVLGCKYFRTGDQIQDTDDTKYYPKGAKDTYGFCHNQTEHIDDKEADTDVSHLRIWPCVFAHGWEPIQKPDPERID